MDLDSRRHQHSLAAFTKDPILHKRLHDEDKRDRTKCVHRDLLLPLCFTEDFGGEKLAVIMHVSACFSSRIDARSSPHVGSERSMPVSHVTLSSVTNDSASLDRLVP